VVWRKPVPSGFVPACRWGNGGGRCQRAITRRRLTPITAGEHPFPNGKASPARPLMLDTRVMTPPCRWQAPSPILNNRSGLGNGRNGSDCCPMGAGMFRLGLPALIRPVEQISQSAA
jgi:hypothetical protein